jgi:hypothetical protein
MPLKLFFIFENWGGGGGAPTVCMTGGACSVHDKMKISHPPPPLAGLVYCFSPLLSYKSKSPTSLIVLLPPFPPSLPLLEEPKHREERQYIKSCSIPPSPPPYKTLQNSPWENKIERACWKLSREGLNFFHLGGHFRGFIFDILLKINTMNTRMLSHIAMIITEGFLEKAQMLRRQWTKVMYYNKIINFFCWLEHFLF